MLFDENWLAVRMTFLIPLILSLSVHEWAHAWTAWMLGDRTAESQGRLTLNPLAHIDPIGTVLLPLLGVPFGWAKPVPINPAFFHHGVAMRTGVMLTALAGPVSNFCVAFLCAILRGLLVSGSEVRFDQAPMLLTLFEMLITMNIALAVFNLLPIPPLDGSRIVDGLLPDGLRSGWDEIARIGPILLMGVLVLLGLTGSRLLTGPIEFFRSLLSSLTGLISG
ncbi:MAG: site-2 protease family protein [Deltaproteobacteria bacterium]